jgi:hypothetical protein
MRLHSAKLLLVVVLAPALACDAVDADAGGSSDPAGKADGVAADEVELFETADGQPAARFGELAECKVFDADGDVIPPVLDWNADDFTRPARALWESATGEGVIVHLATWPSFALLYIRDVDGVEADPRFEGRHLFDDRSVMVTIGVDELSDVALQSDAGQPYRIECHATDPGEDRATSPASADAPAIAALGDLAVDPGVLLERDTRCRVMQFDSAETKLEPTVTGGEAVFRKNVDSSSPHDRVIVTGAREDRFSIEAVDYRVEAPLRREITVTDRPGLPHAEPARVAVRCDPR